MGDCDNGLFFDGGLTPEQRKAFDALKRAIRACERTKVRLLNRDNALYGVNGRMFEVAVFRGEDESGDIPLSELDAPCIVLHRVDFTSWNADADDIFLRRHR